MNKILVSACLLGKRVRYDGKKLDVSGEILQSLMKEECVVSVCPEVDAGMNIPRTPAEISGGDGDDVLLRRASVITKTGEDVTDIFSSGANIALSLCMKHKIRVAILSESSPSCGSTRIYDGQFSASKIDGVGVTTALLRQHGIKVFNQFEIHKAHEALRQAGG